MRPTRPLRPFPSTLLTVVLLVIASANGARAQTVIRPVEFVVTGRVTVEGSGAAIERARVTVERADDGTLLADRVFTDTDGNYVAVFETDAETTVGIDPPASDDDTWVDGVWMGRIGPNPIEGGSSATLRVPWAAREQDAPEPTLEVFDLRGRRIERGETFGSGVYLYRLRFDDRAVAARKFLVLGATEARFELVRVTGPEVASDAADGLGRRVDATAQVFVTVRRAGYVDASAELTVEAETGGVFDASLVEEAPPTAVFTTGGVNTAGEAVLFDASASTAASGGGLEFAWDFGDGQRGQGVGVAHVYAVAGTYDVTLVATATYGAVDSATTQVTIAAAAPPASVDARLVGSITDVAGNLLAGVRASIVGSAVSDTSDAGGALVLDGVPTGVALSIQLRKDGYAEQVVRLTLPADVDFGTFESTLARRASPVVLASIEDGGRVVVADGAVVELPVDGFVRDDGSLVTGGADVRITPLDMSDERASFAFPGGYEGLRPTGERGLLLSYGVMEVVFEQDGEELRLAPGRFAGVEIPVYTPNAEVGDTIALWSMDPSTGLWREEGSGTVVASEGSPTGLALRARVSHFSWWNADKFDDEPYRVIPRCRIRDDDGLPTLEIPPGESCYLNGRVTGGGGPWGNPDTNIPPDNVTPLTVPALTDFLLEASTAGGTLRGSVVVNGPSGATGTVDIVLDPVDTGGGALSFPDTVLATIDPADETDTYTIDLVEGQRVGVSMVIPGGSNLRGRVRLVDPSAAAVDSADFRGGAPGSIVHEARVTGTYTIEVEGTNGQIGAYELTVFLLEDLPLTLDVALELDVRPGSIATYDFEAGTGTFVSVEQRRLEGFSGGRGSVAFVRPDGTELRRLIFSFSSFDLGLIELDATGTWTVVVRVDDLDGRLLVRVNSVPEIGYGESRNGSLETRSTRYYRTPAGVGDPIRGALEAGTGFIGSVSVERAAFGGLDFGVTLNQSSQVATQVMVPNEPGANFLRVGAAFTSQERDPRPYRVILFRQPSPGTPVFDGAGRAAFDATFERFGQLDLHRFEAGAGDGVAVRIEGTGTPSSLGTSVTLQLYRVGSGTPFLPEAQVFDARRNPGEVDVLEEAVFEIDTAGTYVLAVGNANGVPGDVRLTIDRVRAASTITVDDDLADCPDADTRSLLAAFAAAAAGGTVDVCAGTYAQTVELQPARGGLTIQGAGQGLTFLTRSDTGPVVVFDRPQASFTDLTVETRLGSQSDGISTFAAGGTQFRRVTVRAADGTGDVSSALVISSTAGVVVDDCTFVDTVRALEARNSDDLVFTANTVQGGFGLVELELCDRGLVQGNIFTVDDVGVVIQTRGAANRVLDNDATIVTTDIGANLQTKAFQINDDDEAGDQGPTEVRGNRIVTNEGGMLLRVERGNSELICEQNVVTMTSTRGEAALDLQGNRVEPDQRMVVRNNVFAGVRLFESVRVFAPERIGNLVVVNNSFSVAPGTNLGANYPFVIVQVVGGFTGDTGAVLANNVVDGVGSGIAIESPVDVTLTSDWNLFGSFQTYYAGGMVGQDGANDLTGVDPQFADADLRLAPTSPAVDSGATPAEFVDVPTVDVEGTPRPQGAGVDRGAWEQ